MMNDIKSICEVVIKMDSQLRETLNNKMLWENTFIKHQIDKRKNGGQFNTSDHIRAMVYSMMSSGITWKRAENLTDPDTGIITAVDDIFHQYDTEYLLTCDPKQLRDSIKYFHLASQYTLNQVTALTKVNIPKLKSYERKYGSIDTLYNKYIVDKDISCLVWKLSDKDSKMKLAQMGEALIAEYLKNVGYDISKPDRHIRRILGSKHLACSEKEVVPIYEAFDIVSDIANQLDKSVAEVDYILWAYCATGYGEICTAKKPKCSICSAYNMCKSD